MTTYCVTGSSGHLGEALVRTLRAQGRRAVGLDVLASPFTDVVGSVTDRAAVRRALTGVDHVLHTATLHKPHVGTHRRQDFVDTNVTGTLTVLEEAAEAGVRSVVFASSTSTFGRALTPGPGRPAVWITEDVRPRVRNVYGATKIAAEDLCELVAHDRGLPVVVLRLARFFPEPDDRDDVRAAFPSDANLKVNEYLHRRVDLADAVDAHLRAADRAPDLGFANYVVSATTPFTPDDLPRAGHRRVGGGRAPVPRGERRLRPVGMAPARDARPRVRQRPRPPRPGVDAARRLPRGRRPRPRHRRPPRPARAQGRRQGLPPRPHRGVHRHPPLLSRLRAPSRP